MRAARTLQWPKHTGLRFREAGAARRPCKFRQRINALKLELEDTVYVLSRCAALECTAVSLLLEPSRPPESRPLTTLPARPVHLIPPYLQPCFQDTNICVLRVGLDSGIARVEGDPRGVGVGHSLLDST